MLFWIVKGSTGFYSHTANLENICFRGWDIRSVVQSLKCLGSLSFVKHIATEFENRIGIHRNFKICTTYLTGGKRSCSTTEYIPLLGEFENLSSYPQRFVIRTDNLDLVRELIARGHELSWYDPDIMKFAHIFPQLKLEHLFLSAWCGRNIILPTGEVKAVIQRRPYFVFPSMKKVGYSLKGLYSNYALYASYKGRAKLNKRTSLVSHSNQLIYYNILSITYMLCKKSIAMNAKKRIAPKS
jgi:hypothetical protein